MILDRNIDPNAAIDPSKIAGGWLAPKHTDGTLPRAWYVSKGGSDSLGNGKRNDPFLTIDYAIGQAVDHRGDIIYIGPGEYAESVDVDKAAISLIGMTSDPGRVQIIGDGSTARASIRVLDDYVRGFRLMNIEADTNGLAQPAIHIQLDNGDSGGFANTGLRFYLENVQVNSGDPTVGLWLEGASNGRVKDCVFAQADVGIGFAGSLTNFPVDLRFEDIWFWGNVTADVATATSAGAIAAADLESVNFFRPKFMDRGGTPVTNYINYSTGTMVNVGFYDAYFARDIADGTLTVLPADVVILGHSAAGVESIIGA